MAGAYGNMAGAMGNAYGQAAGSLGTAAGNFGAATNTALGNMYGTLGTAQAQYGSASQAARGNMLSSLANTNLGGYNTGASYQADMAKLGLARELGLGQIGVAGSAFAGGGGSGGVSMTAAGEPLGYASGGYSSGGGGGGYGGGGGFGGGGYSPNTSPAWYQSPQYLAPFPNQMPYAAGQMGGADQQVLSGLYGTGAAGGGAIGNNSASTYGQLGALSNQLSNIPGMFNSGMQGIGSAGQQGYANLNRGLASANRQIPGMLNTSMQAMDRDGGNAFGALRNAASQTGAIPGMLNTTMSGINNDFSRSQSGIGSSLGQGYDAINQSRNSINSSPIASYLMQSGQAGRDQLGSSMATNDNLLSRWVNSGMGNMQSAMSSGYGQLNNGMNQFYANIPRDGADLLGSALKQGAGQIGSIGSQLGSAYGSFNNSNNSARQNAMQQVTDLYKMANGGFQQPRQQPLQTQSQMMADARAANAASLAAWKQANPMKPTGNATFDAINRAWYG